MLTEIIYLLISFFCTAILGKLIIPVLKKLKVGQSERLDGPRTHLRKTRYTNNGWNNDDNYNYCVCNYCILFKY